MSPGLFQTSWSLLWQLHLHKSAVAQSCHRRKVPQPFLTAQPAQPPSIPELHPCCNGLKALTTLMKPKKSWQIPSKYIIYPQLSTAGALDIDPSWSIPIFPICPDENLASILASAPGRDRSPHWDLVLGFESAAQKAMLRATSHSTWAKIYHPNGRSWRYMKINDHTMAPGRVPDHSI